MHLKIMCVCCFFLHKFIFAFIVFKSSIFPAISRLISYACVCVCVFSYALDFFHRKEKKMLILFIEEKRMRMKTTRIKIAVVIELVRMLDIATMNAITAQQKHKNLLFCC